MSRLRLLGEGDGGAAHSHAEADIADGSILARLAANEAISGAWDFSAGKLRLTQGLDASKPASGNTEGQVYWATDTDRLYVWDGAVWREVSFRAHAASHQAGGSDLVAAASLRTGLDAGKPASGNTEGDVYWATDTDRLYVWDGAVWKEVGAAGGLKLEGANLTEATTTSTAEVELLSVGGLNIPATTPILVVVSWRKTAGAAAAASFGLKVNTTAVRSPLAVSASSNVAEDGILLFVLSGFATNYGGGVVIKTSPQGGGNNLNDVGPRPNAAVTSVTLTALVGSSSITAGADEMRVYSLPV